MRLSKDNYQIAYDFIDLILCYVQSNDNIVDVFVYQNIKTLNKQ